MDYWMVRAVVAAVLGCSAIWAGAQPSQTASAVKKAGSPAELSFLMDINLPAPLDVSVARDIRTLPPDIAAARIKDRLRLNMVATGFIGTEDAAQSAAAPVGGQAPKVVVDPDAARAWRKALGAASVSREFDMKALGLGMIVTDGQVAAQTKAMYEIMFQINPGKPVSEEKPPTLGAAPAQVLPGFPQTGDVLADCNRSFEEIKNSCGPIVDGMRCERFLRKAFSEVARITTPEGGICSGTVIHPHWVLTAAHCFLPQTSAQQFASRSADRKTAAGDAVMRGDDLRKTQLHLDYTSRLDSSRGVDFVVVNQAWDPKRVIQKGELIEIDGEKLTADVVFPGDIALLRIAEQDSAEADVRPARIASEVYEGFITTAGFGVTTTGDGNPGSLWVTWPEPKINGISNQLELRFDPADSGGSEAKLISSFCVGDSGGPAYSERHRGCQKERPRMLVGITSYYWGMSGASNSPTAAQYCKASPVMRFVSVASPSNRSWICSASSGQASGC